MLFWLNPKNCIYSLFDAHLRYACQVWGQGNSDRLVMIQRAQNRTIRIINFKGERHPSEPQFIEAKTINHTKIFTLHNCMLVLDHPKSSLPVIFA